MPLDFDAHLTNESTQFLSAIRHAAPDARVPACPDWAADDLLWHLGTVQHFWAHVVEHRPQPPADYEEPQRPADRAGLLAFFDDASMRLQRGLRAAADEESAWTWFPPNQSVGFIRRRQAHEALVHRVDAEQTAGINSVIPARLAGDGAVEIVEWMHARQPSWGTYAAAGGTAAIEADDTGHRVVVELGQITGTHPTSGEAVERPAVTVLDPATKADAAYMGQAADLNLWLWHRGPRGDIRVVGDEAVADRFAAVLARPV